MKDHLSFKLIALTILAGVALGLIDPGHADETSAATAGHTGTVAAGNSTCAR
jgi:hypothetical protein